VIPDSMRAVRARRTQIPDESIRMLTPAGRFSDPRRDDHVTITHTCWEV